MTNAQIILTNCAINNITEPVDTFAGWNNRGYKIKKGSKAVFQTKIWKPCKPKKSEQQDENEKRLYLVNASFFALSQVEKIEK